MKVLWFAVTPSMYSQSNISHNGGGWIASLEGLLRDVKDIQLGIAFEHQDRCFRIERNGVTYYPINVWQTKWQRIKRKLIYKTEENRIIPACIKVIEDFKPDIIHIFGSEWCFGLLSFYTNIPIVIHIQGSIPPYYNARFPVGYSLIDFIRYNRLNIKKSINEILSDRFFKLRAAREERILRNCKYFMGRTEWDRNLTSLYAPKANYFYCSEALRPFFLENDKIWKKHKREQIILISTISSPLYKGFDLILKTAKLLKENTEIDFEWRIFGVKEVKFHEWKTKIKIRDVSIKTMGTAQADVLKFELLDSDIFIHPSYIDNSPNSICEAQILGLPVISTNVGGISSLIKHLDSGLLIPSNDPFTMASYINLLIENQELAISLGNNARKTALERHNSTQIIKDLVGIYYKIVKHD